MDDSPAAKNAHHFADDFVGVHWEITAGQRVTPDNQLIVCKAHNTMSCQRSIAPV
jgi:hypothetical protein